MATIPTPPINLMPTGTKYKKLFGKMTSAYYTNMSKIFSTDTTFFTFAPANMRYYYFMVVLQNLYWFRGYVPGIHNQGIFSCGMGTRACYKVANLQYAGGFRIEGENNLYTKFIEEFLTKDKTSNRLKKILPIKEAIGFAMVNIDINLNGKQEINFTNGNRYFVEVDNRGKVQAYRRYINFTTANPINDDNGLYEANSQGYFLVQDRWLYDGQCYQRYKCYKGPATIQNPNVAFIVQGIPFKKLPKTIQDFINLNLGTYSDEDGEGILDRIIQMPFYDSVGAEIILASKTATGVEDYNCFSDSLLQDCKQFLAEFDEIFTDKQLDRALAQKGVILPRAMSPSDLGAGGVSSYSQYLNYTTNQDTLDGHIYEKSNTMNPETSAPFFYQSDYRQQEYNADLDAARRNIADAIGVTPSDLGAHQSNDGGGGDKTAFEVATIGGITVSTVEDKREMITDAMESIFKELLILEFGDQDAKVSMVFNSAESANPMAETDDLIKQVNSSLISKKTAMRRKNKNFNEEEIEKEWENILKEQEEERSKQIEMMGNTNDYGGTF